MTMFDQPATLHQVRNGNREIRFEGWQLGHASSWHEGKERWAEVWLFKTDEGLYLVAGIGRSTRAGEVDRCWASTFTEPDQVIERLYVAKKGTMRHLPLTNRDALLQACQLDAGLAQAYPGG